jgi:hypothetical protein
MEGYPGFAQDEVAPTGGSGDTTVSARPATAMAHA